MVGSVITESMERDEVTVVDAGEAARSVVAQLEAQVLFAKLYNDTQRLSTVWASCEALLGARAKREAAAGR